MEELVKIDDVTLTVGDFVSSLRFMNRFEGLLDDVVKSKMVAIAARRSGMEIGEEEIQIRADQLRRVLQLHRASDMMNYLEINHMTVDDFEAFVIEMLLNEKQEEAVTSDAAVEEYFKLNSPKYESIEISHIALNSEGVAREVFSMLEDDPGDFEKLAAEHSIADSASSGGHIGTINRGSLDPEIEAKAFNAKLKQPIGPHPLPAGNGYEIFMVSAKHAATLDASTRRAIEKSLFDDWVAAKAKEFTIELL